MPHSATLCVTVFHRHCTCFVLFHCQLQVGGNPASGKSISAIFTTTFAYLMSLCPLWVISNLFPHHYICHGGLRSVTFDVTLGEV